MNSVVGTVAVTVAVDSLNPHSQSGSSIREMVDLAAAPTTTRVSSTLNRDTKQFGKKFLIDGSDETCWNSDQGGTSWERERETQRAPIAYICYDVHHSDCICTPVLACAILSTCPPPTCAGRCLLPPHRVPRMPRGRCALGCGFMMGGIPNRCVSGAVPPLPIITVTTATSETASV